MLVGHQVAIPVQALTLGHHGARQVHDLVPIQARLTRRHKEGGDLHLGVAPLRDVACDLHELLGAEPLALYLAPDRIHRCGGLRMADADLAPLYHVERCDRLGRQAQFSGCYERLVVDHVEDREDALVGVAAHLDLGERLEALGAVHGTVSMQVGDVFVVGVDSDTAQGQGSEIGWVGSGFGHGAWMVLGWIGGLVGRARPRRIGS